MLSADTRLDPDEALAARGKELRRSGLVLDDQALQEAWEHGGQRYIPVRLGKSAKDSLATLEQLGLLDKHIRRLLRNMAGQLRAGSIAADPYFRSQSENACLHCDYRDACRFVDGRGGEKCRYIGKIDPENVWAMMEEAESHG